MTIPIFQPSRPSPPRLNTKTDMNGATLPPPYTSKAVTASNLSTWRMLKPSTEVSQCQQVHPPGPMEWAYILRAFEGYELGKAYPSIEAVGGCMTTVCTLFAEPKQPQPGKEKKEKGKKQEKDKKHKKARREEPRVKEEEINQEVEEHVVAQPTEQRRPFFDKVVPQFAIWDSLRSHRLT